MSEEFIREFVNISDDISTEIADTQPIEVKNCEEYTETEKQIIKMLTQNTGVNMLDSGGYGGRAWQQNRKIKNFNDLPNIEYEFIFDDCKELEKIHVSLNIYHFLKEHLLITEKSKKYQEQFEKSLSDDRSWIEEMDNFLDLIEDELEDFSKIGNTYNFENHLSGTLQYIIFQDHDMYWYIILQIHGGADIRGGYTDPYIFQLQGQKYCNDEANYEFEGDTQRLNFTCEKCYATWDTDDPNLNLKYSQPANNESPLEENVNYSPGNVLGIKKQGKAYCKCGGVIEIYPDY